MFVSSNSCREIYKNYFFNDKELPTGDKFERIVYLTLQLFDNPKGNSAYKNIFEMSNGNKFVATTKTVEVTPAQHKLLQIITPIEAEDIFNSLKKVHYLGTYCVDSDMVELSSSGYVHELLNAIQEIANETEINKLLKTA